LRVLLNFRGGQPYNIAVPIYEFSCLSCRQTFDVFGGYASRDQRQVCPECESTNTKAMFSTFAVVGSGEASIQTSGGCACGGSCSCSN
jgi:putative FmdB family regulatory protein